MKIPSGGRTKSVSFNVTSLIDIVFLLVIFFLVASHVARTEAVEPVNLPEATQFDDEDDPTPRRLVVTIKADGALDIAGQPHTMAFDIALGHKLALAPIARGGKIVKYGAPIGSATADIAAGAYVHIHNMKSDYIPIYSTDAAS